MFTILKKHIDQFLCVKLYKYSLHEDGGIVKPSILELVWTITDTDLLYLKWNTLMIIELDNWVRNYHHHHDHVLNERPEKQNAGFN